MGEDSVLTIDAPKKAFPKSSSLTRTPDRPHGASMSHEDPTTHPTDPVSSVSSPPRKRKPPVRVSGYSVELGHRICEIIATTPHPLARLCQLPGMPSVATLMRWLRDHDEFQEAYAIAKQFQMDLLVE